MIIKDIIYGKFEITDPLVLELIGTPEFVRLKGVDQGGYKAYKNKNQVIFKQVELSRYAHSLGVFLLLKKYHAPKLEQYAGLIHDISHSVFSHTIDYILSQGSQELHDHQDNYHEQYLKKSSIPKIFAKYSINQEYLLDDENFSLKEQELPKLCADRIDYALRTAIIAGKISQFQAKNFISHLKVIDKQWVFDGYKIAKAFAQLFSYLNKVYYSGFDSALMFQTTADYIKRALDKKYISFSDLYTTDQKVLKKIKKQHSNDGILSNYFKRMQRDKCCVDNPKNYDQIVVCKSRMVDPSFLVGKEIKCLSSVDNFFKKQLKNNQPKKYYLKFIDK